MILKSSFLLCVVAVSCCLLSVQSDTSNLSNEELRQYLCTLDSRYCPNLPEILQDEVPQTPGEPNPEGNNDLPELRAAPDAETGNNSNGEQSVIEVKDSNDNDDDDDENNDDVNNNAVEDVNEAERNAANSKNPSKKAPARPNKRRGARPVKNRGGNKRRNDRFQKNRRRNTNKRRVVRRKRVRVVRRRGVPARKTNRKVNRRVNRNG